MKRSEFLDCVVRSIEETYLIRGRIVKISIDDTEGASLVHGLELRPSADWIQMRRIDAPPAWLLQETVEAFLADREKMQTRLLDRARALAAFDDHVTVELQGEADAALKGQIALLPRAHIAPRDAGWEIGGPARFVVVRRHFPEQVDGGETWRNSTVRWFASRMDPALPCLLVRYYFDLDVHAVVFNGTCMLIVPTAGDGYARLVGKEGSHITRLRDILGMERVFVAREPQAAEPFARLTCAVARVTGLKRRDYVVKMPGAGGQLPVVVAERKFMPRLVGRGGQNLLFIRRLSGVAFMHAERTAVLRAAA
jgi:hypothetical protein